MAGTVVRRRNRGGGVMAFVLDIDPMPALREDAKAKVTRFFNREAAAMTHQDAAYAAKRAAAARMQVGEASEQLVAEAALRGISAEDLAREILSKPDTVAEREHRRQTVLAAIRSAATPQQLKQVMAIYG
ncbi:hypothetical protein DYI24_01120 [Rhodopseudomonas sp. BR0C11]|uniref:hypothetical protein n=1 Tax=Rhodopseudomonas sp. BR0C11 TaxID=2269370 RepID=UPI0013E0C541|nr:hypothetical protein [Rhodopseudomonas sp. BR0C11]NEV75646.1 hypothetical protein [Rhodopseudomonas sp. BR0C11]